MCVLNIDGRDKHNRWQGWAINIALVQFFIPDDIVEDDVAYYSTGKDCK